MGSYVKDFGLMVQGNFNTHEKRRTYMHQAKYIPADTRSHCSRQTYVNYPWPPPIEERKPPLLPHLSAASEANVWLGKAMLGTAPTL